MPKRASKFLPIAFSAAVGAIYFVSNPRPNGFYDYTFRIAGELLQGRLGLSAPPPGWLNEFVPLGGMYYSVFPLGAVLTMLPLAVLHAIGLLGEVPGGLIAGLIAAAIAFLLFKIAAAYELATDRAILSVAGMLFGTWTWMNLTFAGAWQLALGFAVLGELGAIYFTFIDRRPFLAGAFFALGFGNRTEILLTAPIFFYLLLRDREGKPFSLDGIARVRFLKFCAVPFILGVATLIYNQARFGSPLDFGYARIPGVLREPWYNHGIFSIEYIPRQAWEMLFKLWNFRETFPYLVPDGFSSSIVFSSPFLLFAFRRGALDRSVKFASWAAVVVLTILLWMHGNSGGWQFGYRYAMVLLPWLFVILCENARERIGRLEYAAYIFSFAANAYAVWIFHWTTYARP